MTSARPRFLALASVAVLALLAPLPAAAPASPRGGPVLEKGVLVVLVPRVSFEQLLAIPEMRALSRAGGTALMSSSTALRGLLSTAFPKVQISPIPSATIDVRLTILQRGAGPVREPLGKLGEDIRREVARFSVRRLLVVVAAPSESEAMLRAKDELTPIVMATGAPGELFPPSGPLHSLASDTTRRTGVVSDLDVVPSILAFLGRPAPGARGGSLLRVADAPAPFALHARHLANRRMTVPVQTGAGIFVTVAGLFAIALLALRRRVPAWLGHGAAWLSLTVPALGTALLAAGHLPALRYSTVVPLIVVVALAGTVAFVPLRRFGLLVPPAAIGAAVLAYFVLEAALGWTAAQTPFLGGSELDGGRFYGLPNAFIGLLMGSSLYVATRLRPVAGFVLVVAAGLFAGLPGIGANLGGALTLFAAAGLWLGLRARGRLGWREAGLVAGVVVAGMAVVLAAHVFLTASPTHATRFVEGAGRTPSGIWRTVTHRLLVGWRLIVRNPFALVPVLGVPACLLLLLRPPAVVANALVPHPEWRDAMLVILLGSVVAYFANDSGAAAVGAGFGTALSGILYVSLSEQTWKMGTT